VRPRTERGIEFHVPVRGIDPLGVVHHPAVTVTVDDVEGLRAALAREGA
jgi:predicted DNA-binding protein (UPF0251 family)